jgi:hypothetical protein
LGDERLNKDLEGAPMQHMVVACGNLLEWQLKIKKKFSKKLAAIV